MFTSNIWMINKPGTEIPGTVKNSYQTKVRLTFVWYDVISAKNSLVVYSMG
ncbi:MAG: hypothetical protein ABGU93_10565 [Acetobacterium sp.]|uniref:hypothetical protein n=1 Tax=Acetobacterium sp. TaxID=1872094 RepID=UPI00324224A6